MNLLQQKINDRLSELLAEYGSHLEIEYNLWFKYPPKFDLNLWYDKFQSKYYGIGSFVDKPDFNEDDWKRLISYAEKAFEPCLRPDTVLNLEEFVIDVLIRIIHKKQEEMIKGW